jgi:Xaa-Pro aminopeptidase
MAQGEGAARPSYTGPIECGMVFDFEPGKKHQYERLTITRKEGPLFWARGRCGETFHEEPEFRNSVVLVSQTPLAKPRPVPLPLEQRYEGPLQIGMVFDFEPGKKHMYERLTITELKGSHIWARGRCGQTYYEERDFRDHVVPVPGERR